jgi:hypothetical protein
MDEFYAHKIVKENLDIYSSFFSLKWEQETCLFYLEISLKCFSVREINIYEWGKC